MNTWIITFDDGLRVTVLAGDIQDAVKKAHGEAGAKYTYSNMVGARRI